MSVSDAEKEELDSASECGKWEKNEERKKIGRLVARLIYVSRST